MRKYRVSICGAEYFLTVCTKGRKAGLQETALVNAIRGHEARLENEGVWHVRCAVVMPDHWHALVALTGNLKLAAVMKRFKDRLTPALRRVGLSWQSGFYDHRMRANEDRVPVFRYVFLNPYRRGLLKPEERWPGYWCREADWEWFQSLTADGGALPEWVG